MNFLKKTLTILFSLLGAAIALVAVAFLIFAFLDIDTNSVSSTIKSSPIYSDGISSIVEKVQDSTGLKGPKIIPEDGPDIEPAKITFTFEDRTYSVTGAVDKRIYHGATNSPRSFVSTFNRSEVEKQADYMRAFVDDPAQQDAIDALCEAFRAIKKKRGFSSDTYAEFITKYVQTIPYDVERASAGLADQTLVGDPRFPVQTIVDGKGDCDEKVFLLAALLKHEGYGCAAFLYSEEKHLCLGIKSEGAGYKNSGYEIVETTSPMYISEVPQEFAGGVKLTSVPRVVEFGGGDKSYASSSVDDVAYIVHARDTALGRADSAKLKAEAAQSKAVFERYKQMYEDCFEAYNTLQTTVDENGEHTNDFKDRNVAISWLNGHDWWTGK